VISSLPKFKNREVPRMNEDAKMFLFTAFVALFIGGITLVEQAYEIKVGPTAADSMMRLGFIFLIGGVLSCGIALWNPKVPEKTAKIIRKAIPWLLIVVVFLLVIWCINYLMIPISQPATPTTLPLK